MPNTPSFKYWDWATVGLVAVWAETLLYGIYTTLFWCSMFIMLKGFRERPMSAKIVIWSAAMIYFVGTAHISIGLYSVLQRYVRFAGTPAAETPWLTVRKWEGFAYAGLTSVVVWIFDCLLIFRCYIVWSKNWYIMVAPIVLFVSSVAIKVPIFTWLSYEDPTRPSPYRQLSFAALPIEFVQNILTTALICFRLIRQSRASRAAGIQPNNSRLSLSSIVRIIIESAAIYPILLFITSILWSIQSERFWILFGMYCPIIGIVSILLTIRLHIATARREQRTTVLTLSAWINDNGPPDDDAPQPVQGEHPLAIVKLKSLPSLAPETL